MTIWPDKHNYVLPIMLAGTAGMSIVGSISSAILYHKVTMPDFLYVLLGTFLFAFTALQEAMVLCKTVVLDQDGVSVYFWRFHKRFSWDDFATKRAGRYYYMGTPLYPVFDRPLWIPSSKGMIFSTKASPFRKIIPDHFFLNGYGFLQPMSTFFVFFEVGHEEIENAYYVDENYFLRNLKQWGVEWETVESGRIRKFFKKVKSKMKKMLAFRR